MPKKYDNDDYNGTNHPINVVDPTSPQDAATKNYVDTHVTAKAAAGKTGALDAMSLLPELTIVTEAFARTGVISGCQVTQRAAGANQSVDVAAGIIAIANTQYNVTATNVVITGADSTNDRIDIISVDSSGTPVVTTGTAANPPEWPTVAALNNGTAVCLALVYVNAFTGVYSTESLVNSNASDTTTTTATVNVPSSTVAGDTMILFGFGKPNGGGTLTAPAGWIAIDTGTAAGTFSFLGGSWQKTATAGDLGGTVTVTISSNSRVAAIILSYHNVNVTPVDVHGVSVSSSDGTNAIAPSVTTTVDNEYVVTGFGMFSSTGSNTLTGPTTQRQNNIQAGGDHYLSVGASDILKGAHGASGTATTTSTVTSSWIAFTVALKPYQVGSAIQNANIYDKREVLGAPRSSATRLYLDGNPTRRGLYAGIVGAGTPSRAIPFYPSRVTARTNFR